MELSGKVAVVTGGAGGIGHAVCRKLAEERVETIAVVDRSERAREMCAAANQDLGREVLIPFVGDVVDASFRESVFTKLEERFGPVSICVPAAAITLDRYSVKVSGGGSSPEFELYPEEDFRRVMEIDLIAPIYWGLRTIASVGKDRARRGLKGWSPGEPLEGCVVLIGSVSSEGNRGQVAYATAKKGLEGAQATLAVEAIFHGVRCGLLHPGYTDTPMARALGDQWIEDRVLPNTELGRLIKPEEIADAVCFLLKNDSISRPLWADAGWHPPAR